MSRSATADVREEPRHAWWAGLLAKLLWTASLVTGIGLGVDIVLGVDGIRWQFVTLWIISIVAADAATRGARGSAPERPSP